MGQTSSKTPGDSAPTPGTSDDDSAWGGSGTSYSFLSDSGGGGGLVPFHGQTTHILSELEAFRPDPFNAQSGAGGASGGGSGGNAGSGGTTGVVGNTTVPGLVINIIYDSSVNSAPAGFKAAIASVVQFYQATFHNPITITLDIGWGEVGGTKIGPGILGESLTYLNLYSYSQLRTALINKATSADQKTAVATLPTTNPTGNGNFAIATGEAKALGLAANSNAIDGYVGFGTGVAYTFDPNNRAVAGKYDLIGVAEHEFTEVMGRISMLGESLGSLKNNYSALDLFRYSGTNTRQLVGGKVAYFSLDGGKTNLDNFNTVAGADYGDWAPSAGNDSYNAFGASGVAELVTASDIREMNVLGFKTT